MEAPKPGSGEAVLAFTTKLPEKYRIPDEHMVLPSSLGRYGLSEVVNQLLEFTKPVPFDFLVGGEFLRTNVEQYLETRKLSTETVLTVEYVFALSQPEPDLVDEVPDWISGLVALQPLPSPRFAAVGYDGTVRLYEGTTSRLTVQLSGDPLKGVVARPLRDGRASQILAPCQDGSLHCVALEHGDGAAAEPRAGAVRALRRPSASGALEAAAINEDGTLLAGGGWDADISVWNAASELFPSPGSQGAVGEKRKAASSEEGAPPKFVLKGHSQAVTCLEFGAPARFPFTLLSGSWDCSVRVWDIAAASCVCNWTVARAVTAFSLSPAAEAQMATSHEDGHVSLWDIRASPHATVRGALALDMSAGLPLASAQVPHRRLAAQVAWCPVEATRLASVGHDGHLCVLDPRSPKMPLHALQVGKAGVAPNKLLCVAWLGREELVVGGSDGKVVRLSLREGTAVASEGA